MDYSNYHPWFKALAEHVCLISQKIDSQISSSVIAYLQPDLIVESVHSASILHAAFCCNLLEKNRVTPRVGGSFGFIAPSFHPKWQRGLHSFEPDKM